MHEPPLLNIVGAGKVGRSLARLWHLHDVFSLQDVLNRSAASAHDAVTFIGAGRPCCAIQELRPAAVWLIGVGDDSIGECCDHLVATGKVHPGNVVFHCSGALPSTVLLAATNAQAWIASVHPIHSFAVPEKTVAEFAGTWCGTEGDDHALVLLEDACRSVGALPVRIATDKKTLYHAAAVFASNYLVTLMDVALRAYASAGISPESASEMLKPLMLGTMENVLRVGPDLALSGPIARGEFGTVATQQQAVLEWDADCGELYGTLARLTAELAARRRGGQIT